MATVHSSRTCLPKLCCSIAAIGLFITGILLTGAYPHQNFDHFNLTITNGTNLASTENFTLKGVTANRITRSLKTTVEAAQKKALQTILLAYIFSKTDTQVAILHKFLSQINHSKSRASRSPRTIKAMQTFEAAITKFDQNQPKPEYQISEYATGNRRWKRAPSVHPIEITELLNYEVQKKHNRNKILGDKVARIFKQNTNLSDKIATPSEKLRKDPVMALVTRTISTYMLVRHSKNGKGNSKQEDLSPWGNPFFNKQNKSPEYQHQTRMARSPKSSMTAKEETPTEWFLRKLATSPFPIQTIRTLEKALNILTNTTPENK
jgi:hypothetical protein